MTNVRLRKWVSPCSGQQGFSLLEALFSAFVLGVALFGLAKFHSVAVQDGGAIKARSLAASIASRKIEDLRSFSRVSGGCSGREFCFSEIASNAGGLKNGDGSLLFPSGSVSGSGENYALSWTVACANESAGTALTFGGGCANPHAKLVTVTVEWTDNKGNPQSTSLQSVIYATDPIRLAQSAGVFSSNKSPKVSYTPIGVPDAVPVPISTSDDRFKETSKPIPTVSKSVTGINVSFDSVIYSMVPGSPADDKKFVRDSQEDFETVTCECEFLSGTGAGMTPTRKVWNGSQLVTQVGESVTKVRGQPLGNKFPDNCDICCRDHHDRAENDAKYDPQRPAADFTPSGNHKHYWYADCVSGMTGNPNCNANSKNSSLGKSPPLAEVTSGAYLESCRVGRVDGVWRVMQDWRLRKVSVFPYNYLMSSANLANYQGVVAAVVENAVKTDTGEAGVAIPILSGRNLLLPMGSPPVQLLARAVYVDTIYLPHDDPSTAANERNTIDSGYYAALKERLARSKELGDSAWLEFAPFHEANLTLLFDWTSSHTPAATVTSQAIDVVVDPANNYYGSFSRGRVMITPGNLGASTTVTATARVSNSGITGGVNKTGTAYVAGQSFGTDLHDNGVVLSDSITVERVSSTSTLQTIVGRVLRGNSSTNVREVADTSPGCSGMCSASPLTVSLATTTGTSTGCNPLFGDLDVNAWVFSCTVSNGWAGSITVGSSGSVYTLDGATNTSKTITIPPVTGTLTLDPIVAYGSTVTIRGDVSSSDFPAGNPKPNVTVANTTVTFSGTASGSCSKQLVGKGANEAVRYTCQVPRGWTGAVTVSVDPAGGAYTYLSEGGSPCNGTTSGSCTMNTISSALADIDGTLETSTEAQRKQTNVTVRR